MSQSFRGKSSPNDSRAGKLGATRVDGWKEIASYLGRGERTVKRWEADRGLPIHRVPGGARGSVYAYTAELTDWLNSNRTIEPVTEKDEEEIPSPEAVSPEKGRSVVAEEALASSDLAPLPLPTAALGFPDSLLSSSGHRQRWLLGSAAVVLVGMAVASTQLAALHHRTLSIPTTVSSLFAKKVLVSGRAGSPPAVTASEVQLARELYLKGRYDWNQRSPESLNRALDDFTQAIVHNPNDAKSYVGLADTYSLLREYSSMPDQEAFSRSIVAAKKAVELDDSLAEAHRALAFAERYGSWDFADAEKEFRRAIELNPNDPVAHRWYANAIAVSGRYPESLQQMNQAQELDPTSHSTLADKGMLLFNAGSPKEGMEILEQVERSEPDFQSSHRYLMRIAFANRNYPAYLSEGKITAELDHDPVLKNEIARAQAGYARAGKRGLLQALYDQQRTDHTSGKLAATFLARTCLELGKKREAMQLLEEDYAHHQEYMIAASLSDPILLTLRDEPAFRALMKKINFPGASLESPEARMKLPPA